MFELTGCGLCVVPLCSPSSLVLQQVPSFGQNASASSSSQNSETKLPTQSPAHGCRLMPLLPALTEPTEPPSRVGSWGRVEWLIEITFVGFGRDPSVGDGCCIDVLVGFEGGFVRLFVA